jgi:hypothetical protein
VSLEPRLWKISCLDVRTLEAVSTKGPVEEMLMIQQEAEPSFDAATQTYLAWMARYCALDEQGLKLKQAKMRDSHFAFLRGTFYR